MSETREFAAFAWAETDHYGADVLTDASLDDGSAVLRIDYTDHAGDESSYLAVTLAPWQAEALLSACEEIEIGQWADLDDAVAALRRLVKAGGGS